MSRATVRCATWAWRTRSTAPITGGWPTSAPRPRAVSSGRWWPTCATSRRASPRSVTGRSVTPTVGVYISPQAPGGKLLDNPDLYPLYEVAQELDLPLLAHGGTSRPPYGPGSFDLDGAWFL